MWRGIDQSHEAHHPLLLIAPPSILIQHRHELARFIEEETQAPANRRERQEGDKHHRRRIQIKPEVHCIRLGQTSPPRGERLGRRLRSSQICRWRSLLYPRKLRGMALLLYTLSQRLQVPQRTKANKQAIESLAPRIKALAELLCPPVPKDDTKERERRNKLEQ